MKKCKVQGCSIELRCRELCGKHYTRWLRHKDPYFVCYGHAPIFLEAAINSISTDCILWPFGKSTGGYAQIHIKRIKRDAHRVICERVHGKPPTPKHHAAHSCGNGHLGCINPQHINWKTAKENSADRLHHGTSNHGARNGNAKLNDTLVKKIRTSKDKQKLLAAQFGVSQQTIADIKQRRRWRHI